MWPLFVPRRAAVLLLLASCLAPLFKQSRAACSKAGADCDLNLNVNFSLAPHRCGLTARGGLTCCHSFQAACAGKVVNDACDSYDAQCCGG